MSKRLVGIGVFVMFMLLLGLVFYNTGGRGLVQIIPNYLMADIPDKRYGWSDFVPNYETRRVSGFYSASFSNEHYAAIWTLSGLKRFAHLQGTSVYNHRDSCQAWRMLTAAPEDGGQDTPVMGEDVETAYFDLAKWRDVMKQEYPVTVQWVEAGGVRVVDKLWSVSGRYKVLGLVGESVCE